MNILFWIFKSRVNKNSNAPIKMRVTINGKRADITTGIEIPIDKWNAESQHVNGKDELAIQYNNTILTLRSLVVTKKRNSLKHIPKIRKITILILLLH